MNQGVTAKPPRKYAMSMKRSRPVRAPLKLAELRRYSVLRRLVSLTERLTGRKLTRDEVESLRDDIWRLPLSR